MSFMPTGHKKDDDVEAWTAFWKKNKGNPVSETGSTAISTNTISAEESYKSHKQKLKAVLDELRESARSYFKETVKALFEAHPILESFAWTQYTPYWNDGDETHFGVNDLCELNGEEDPSFSKWDAKTRKSVPGSNPLSQAGYALNELLCNIDDRDMESMFGNHVKVMVTKDNISIQEYDHE